MQVYGVSGGERGINRVSDQPEDSRLMGERASWASVD